MTDLEKLFSNIDENKIEKIDYLKLVEKEILYYKARLGIREFMKKIKIGKYSNFWMIKRSDTIYLPIEKFKDILVNLGIINQDQDLKSLCDIFDGQKISYTLKSPDYLFFDLVSKGEMMRVMKRSWD